MTNAQKNDLKSFLIKAVIVMVAALMLLYCIISAAKSEWNPTKWKGGNGTQQEQEGANIAGSGLIADDELKANGITFKKTSIPVELYNDYGVSALAETALQLAVTATNSGADLSDGVFTIKYKNASSEWAKVHTISDHVTLSSTNSTQATVSCLKAFGEQIIVVYTFTGEKDGKIQTMTAEYPLDYAKRITGVTITGASPAASLKNGSNYNSITLTNARASYSYNLTYSDYTVDDTYGLDQGGYVKFAYRALDGLSSVISDAAKEFYIISSSENGKITFDLTEIVSALEIKNNLIKSEVKSVIDVENGNEGIMEICVEFRGSYGHYIAVFEHCALDISAFGVAARGVQWKDGGNGKGHIF